MATTRTGRTSTVGDQVYTRLRTMVLEFELPPGAALAETELSDQLGVSRTPIREALGRLAREGLVRHYPGRGAFVSEISIPDIIELYEMREALESHAARLAAEADGRDVVDGLLELLEQERGPVAAGQTDAYYRLMTRLDETIIDLAGNGRLAVALSEVWAQVSRARRMAAQSPTRLVDTIDEHAAILQAIRSGDPETAAAKAREHVRNSLANITSSIQPRYRSAGV